MLPLLAPRRAFTSIASSTLPILLLMAVAARIDSVGSVENNTQLQQQPITVTEPLSETGFIAGVDALKHLSDAIKANNGKAFRAALKLLEPRPKKSAWTRFWRKLTSMIRRCRKSLKCDKCKQKAREKLAEHTKRLEENGERLVREANGNASPALVEAMNKLRAVKKDESLLRQLAAVGKKIFKVGQKKAQKGWNKLQDWAKEDDAPSAHPTTYNSQLPPNAQNRYPAEQFAAAGRKVFTAGKREVQNGWGKVTDWAYRDDVPTPAVPPYTVHPTHTGQIPRSPVNRHPVGQQNTQRAVIPYSRAHLNNGRN